MSYHHNYLTGSVLKFNFFLAVSLIGPFAIPAAEAKEYYFGIVSQQSVSRLANIWLQFTSDLSKESGLNIRFATSKEIPTYEKCLGSGAFDITTAVRAAQVLSKNSTREFELKSGVEAGNIDHLQETGKSDRLPSTSSISASILR